MNKHLVVGGLLLAALPAFAPMAIAANATKTPDTVCKAKTYEIGVRYYQQSATAMALQEQAYNLATKRFKEIMASYDGDQKPAVVTDIDETLFDNSPLFVRDMQHCHEFTSWDTWGQWEQKGNPTLIPGAKAFLDYVDSQGVKIFYVTGRMPENKSYTLASMRKLGLPQVSKDNTYVLWTKPKEWAFSRIRKDYDIIMMLGDELADMGKPFEGDLTTEQRRELVKKNASKFGKQWFILPNSVYGPWEKAKLDAWTEPMPASVKKDK